MLQVFIPLEHHAGETRVAATPETVKKLVQKGCAVLVQSGAGEAAHLSDQEYRNAGAEIAPDAGPWSTADVVLTVGPLGDHPDLGRPESQALKEGSTVVGFLNPYGQLDSLRALADGGVTALSMEMVPRISRAQSMDALSSQASIGGYKAVLLAAGRLDRYFPLLMTAAGTIPPSRVVVMGAGVAGLQAVATARRLGAVVEVSDIREAVQEQVESLGGKFIPLPLEESGEGEGGYAREMGEEFLRRQREIVAERLREADVVITTALVPGKKAPMLVSREMVEGMRPGAVVVDMAVAQGGNCELSQADREVEHQGVLILGPTNLPAEMPHDASMLYARNVLNLLEEALVEGGAEGEGDDNGGGDGAGGGDARLNFDFDNEVLDGAVVTHGGAIRHSKLAELAGRGSDDDTQAGDSTTGDNPEVSS